MCDWCNGELIKGWLILAHRQERSCLADKIFHSVLPPHRSTLYSPCGVDDKRKHSSQPRPWWAEAAGLALKSTLLFLGSMDCLNTLLLWFWEPGVWVHRCQDINSHGGFNSVLNSRKLVEEALSKLSSDKRKSLEHFYRYSLSASSFPLKRWQLPRISGVLLTRMFYIFAFWGPCKFRML